MSEETSLYTRLPESRVDGQGQRKKANPSIWVRAVMQKPPMNAKKTYGDRLTDRWSKRIMELRARD